MIAYMEEMLTSNRDIRISYSASGQIAIMETPVPSESVSVRSLMALAVDLDGEEFIITLERTRDTPVDVFLTEIGAEWEAKVAERSSSAFFSVTGDRFLHQAPARRIYARVFHSPYENDEQWRYTVKDRVGFLCLGAPSVVNSGREPTASSRATCKAATKRRTPSQVLICPCRLT